MVAVVKIYSGNDEGLDAVLPCIHSYIIDTYSLDRTGISADIVWVIRL